MTDKAVILARGLGTRMQRAGTDAELDPQRAALAGQGLKVLMPLRGRPMLDYAVDGLRKAGVRSICLVVAPDAELMREHAGRIGAAAGVRVQCAVQDEPRGTADAVLAAERFAGEEAFIVCNGDDLYPPDAVAGLVQLDDSDCWVAAFDREALQRHGNIAADRVKDLAVVTADAAGDLLRIVEKPPDPERYACDGKVWVNMNLYRFTPAIFGACRSIAPHPRRGEYELTAAVEHLRASGGARFRVMFCRGGVLDLTSRGDVASAERALEGREPGF